MVLNVTSCSRTRTHACASVRSTVAERRCVVGGTRGAELELRRLVTAAGVVAPERLNVLSPGVVAPARRLVPVTAGSA